MIHVVLPPVTRPSTCPLVQRTSSLLQMLGRLGEPVAVYAHETEPFGPTGYGGRAQHGDLVFFPWNETRPLVPHTISVECGVGYETRPWGPWRVYESEAWRHYCFGKYEEPLERRRASWVIPWAFDPEEWPLGAGAGGYVSYLGRLAPDKGIKTILRLAHLMPDVRFKIGSTENAFALGRDVPPTVEFVGSVLERERAAFLGGAVAHLCPTEYVEPLGGSAVEAMLCGTPVVSSNYGGFTESILHGVSGFRCMTVDEMVRAIRDAETLSRDAVRAVAEARYSQNVVTEKWRIALAQMRAFFAKGELDHGRR